MPRRKVETDERLVAVEARERELDPHGARGPGAEAGKGLEQGRGGKRARRSRAPRVSAPYDPNDLPLTREAEAAAKRVRSSSRRRAELYGLCDALARLGLPTKRFLDEAWRLGHHLPVWRAEADELEAARADCAGVRAMELEYLASVKSCKFGVKQGPEHRGDLNSSGYAVYRRESRERREKWIASLPQEPPVPRRECAAISEAEALLAVATEVAALTHELDGLVFTWERPGAAGREGDKIRARARRQILKVVADLEAVGVDRSSLGALGRMTSRDRR